MNESALRQGHQEKIGLFALGLGILGQYLFVGHAPGVSVVLFVIGFYAIYFYAVGGRDAATQTQPLARLSEPGSLLLVPVILLALTYVLYANPLFQALNVLVLPVLIGTQLILFTHKDIQDWEKPAFIGILLRHLVALPVRGIKVPFGLLAARLRRGKPTRGHESGKKAHKVLLGLVMAAPVLVIVISLLASADPIFLSWINHFPQWMEGISMGEGVFRTVFAIGISLYVFGLLWGLLWEKSLERHLPVANTTPQIKDKARVEQPFPAGYPAWPGEPLRIDPLTANTFLLSINVVYVLFAAIQFSYLFGAAQGFLPEGTVYADYARRGFAELLLVAVINLGLLLIGLFLVRKQAGRLDTVRKSSLSLLMGCTIVMLISAYSRLSLYEDAYGYTVSRLLAHGFMLVIGVWLLIALLRIWRESFSLGKVYIVTALAAYVILNYANLEARIAVNNSTRYEQSGNIDIAYLSDLSADAYPALNRLLIRYPKLEGLADAVANIREESRRMDGWPSWNISRKRVS